MAIERVSCIGLGRMGGAIAENIRAAGFDLTVHNRTPAKMQPFADKGVRTAESPQAAAVGADAVVTTLMDDASVVDTTTGPDGILAGLAPGAVHICTTTISPATADRLAALHAAHGSDYLAAPVLGRPDVAAAGQLRTFVAGPSGVIESCRALFAAFTSAVIPVGERAGIANVLKLCANFTIAAWIELAGEVYTLAEKNGAQPEIVNGILDAIGVYRAHSRRVRRGAAQFHECTGRNASDRMRNGMCTRASSLDIQQKQA